MEPVLRREGGSSWPAKGRKGTYKVRNWCTYNECLVQRGSIILWFNEEALGQWLHTDPPSKRGHPFVYSQIAITCLLVVRELFRLPYRQLEGLARSIMQCLGLDLPVPDYTTLAKRAARLGGALKPRRWWPRIQGHGNCTGPPLTCTRGDPWGAEHGAEAVEGAYGVSSPESGGDGRFSARGDVRRSVEEPGVCHRADGDSSAVREIEPVYATWASAV